MKWIVVSESYLSYLRQKEPRIPYTDYGSDKFKPFFGILFETDHLYYVSQISSAKERHLSMKQNLDFFKLYDEKTNRLLAVINLNYMFPVPKTQVTDLNFHKIEEYRDFNCEKQKSQYIHFLKLEMKLINKMDIGSSAKELYQLKQNHPEHPVSRRCFDFKLMEQLASNYRD